MTVPNDLPALLRALAKQKAQDYNCPGENLTEWLAADAVSASDSDEYPAPAELLRRWSRRWQWVIYAELL